MMEAMGRSKVVVTSTGRLTVNAVPWILPDRYVLRRQRELGMAEPEWPTVEVPSPDGIPTRQRLEPSELSLDFVLLLKAYRERTDELWSAALITLALQSLEIPEPWELAAIVGEEPPEDSVERRYMALRLTRLLHPNDVRAVKAAVEELSIPTDEMVKEAARGFFSPTPALPLWKRVLGGRCSEARGGA